MKIMQLLYPIFFIPFFLLLLSCYCLMGGKQAKKSGGTSPKTKFWLTGVIEVFKNGHRFLDWTTELLEASPSNTVTTFFAVFTADPANVEHMLKTNFDNYPKGRQFMTTFEDFLGLGIFNSDGETWKHQRKTASLQFSTRLMRGFALDNVQFVVHQRLIPLLRKAAAGGENLDLQDVLDRLAFDNVCKVAFDVDPEYLGGGAEEGRKFAQAFDEAMILVSERFRSPPFLWKLKKLFNAGGERRLRAAIATVHGFAEKVVKSRKKAILVSGSGAETHDLLSRFVADGNFSDDILRDVTVSLILAGRDTTSSALTWFFWILTSRPDVEMNVLEEVRSVRRRHGNTDGYLNLEQLKELEYLHAALSETLRLYPVVPLETRSCLEDDVMPDGTFVPKGSIVMNSSYAMGRSEAIWGEDCMEFKPERWLEKGIFQPKSQFKYPVFHAGPRMCLGKDMAYTQMKSVAVSVLEEFEMEVAEEDKRREHLFTTVLRMKGGLPVKLRERLVQ